MRLHDTNKARKVRSALVHARSFAWYAPRKEHNPHQDFLGIFGALSNLPNLQSLTVDLDDTRLTIRNLLAALQGECRLRELKLSHVKLEGQAEDYQLLQEVLGVHPGLTRLSFLNCKGTAAIQALLMAVPALQDVSLVSTPLGRGADGTTGSFLIEFCRQCPLLRSLVLDEVTDLVDGQQIVRWANKFANPSFPSQIHELAISSSLLLGDVAGESLARLLMTNRSIQKCTLQLCGPWDNCGASMASVLRCNVALTKLSLGIPGCNKTEVTEKANELAKALLPENSPDSKLKRLYLHLDIDCILDGDLEGTEMIKTFERVLNTNDNLKDLSLLDACTYPFELTTRIDNRLLQNRTGIPKLLHRKGYNIGHFHEAYVERVIANRVNLDMTFFALSQMPSIVALAASGWSTGDNIPINKHSNECRTSSTTTRHKRRDSLTNFLVHPFHDIVERHRHRRPAKEHSSETVSTSYRKASAIQRLLARQLPLTNVATTRAAKSA